MPKILRWQQKWQKKKRYGNKIAIEGGFHCCCPCGDCCEKPDEICFNITGALTASGTMTKLSDCPQNLSYDAHFSVPTEDWCDSSNGEDDVAFDMVLTCNGNSTDYFWDWQLQGLLAPQQCGCLVESTTGVDGAVTLLNWTCTPFHFEGRAQTYSAPNPGCCNCGEGTLIFIEISECLASPARATAKEKKPKKNPKMVADISKAPQEIRDWLNGQQHHIFTQD